MASPPYGHGFGTSISPPYPPHAQLPLSKKRPSDLSSAPLVKRRKPSIMSTASNVHPLRQTSFPPGGPESVSHYARSPSVDTMSISGSVADVGVKKKRGRKAKGVDDAASAVGGRAMTAVSGVSGRGGASRALSPEEEEEVGQGVDVSIAARTQEEKEKDAQHRAMLVSAFDEEQFRRYECWRQARLSDAVVRRLINQTLSQSVPGTVILAVKSVTKIFAGEIIERARKIQLQWIDASNESQTGLQSPPASDNDDRSRERRRGPLTADHLREALRRYKLERDDGLVGVLGLGRLQNPSGCERYAIRAMGKRLLK